MTDGVASSCLPKADFVDLRSGERIGSPRKGLNILVLDAGSAESPIGIGVAVMTRAGHRVFQLDPSSVRPGELPSVEGGIDLLWANELGRIDEKRLQSLLQLCRASVLFNRESYFALGSEAALRVAKPLFAYFDAVVTPRIRTVADLTSHGAKSVFLVWPSTSVPTHEGATCSDVDVRARLLLGAGPKAANVHLITHRAAALCGTSARVVLGSVEGLAPQRFQEMMRYASTSIFLAIPDETQLNDTDALLPWALATGQPVFAHRSFGQEALLGPDFPFFFDDCDGIRALYRREIWPSWSPNERLLRAVSADAQLDAIIEGVLP